MEKYTPVEILISRKKVEYEIDKEPYVGEPNFSEETLGELETLRNEADPEAYGEKLCEIAFRGEAKEGFAILWSEIKKYQRRFRLLLNISTDEGDKDLHDLWWECLLDPKDKNLSLSRDVRTPLSRYGGTGGTKLIEEILRVLVVVSNPEGLGNKSSGYGHLPTIGIEEANQIDDVLRNLTKDRVKYKILTEKTSIFNIHDHLRGGGYHILHIVAHGGLKRNGQGYLLLENDETQKVATVDDITFRRVLLNVKNLQLVLLYSCHSMAKSGVSPEIGLAQQLVQGGKAVIAMQDQFKIKTAHRFTESFYNAFLEYPDTLGHVDASVNDARNQLSWDQDRPPWDWAVPVVFLNGDGLLYQPPPPSQSSGPNLARGAMRFRPEIKESTRKPEISANKPDIQQLMEEEKQSWMEPSQVPLKSKGRPMISGLKQSIQTQQPLDYQWKSQQGIKQIKKQISGLDIPKITKHVGKRGD